MIIDKVTAILSLRPNAQFHFANDTLTWQDTEQTQPTEEEINTELTRLQTEYNAQQYARSRASEYPPIGDQLDALFHAGVFPADMAAQIQAVKDKYPKG